MKYYKAFAIHESGLSEELTGRPYPAAGMTRAISRFWSGMRIGGGELPRTARKICLKEYTAEACDEPTGYELFFTL